jgi:alpha/beta superfamily hydrolase
MNNLLSLFISPLFFFSSTVFAQALPSAPTDASHPGSKIYQYQFEKKSVKCSGRNVDVFLPISNSDSNTNFPVIVFGHGQALNLANYQATFAHLAQKGVAVIFPQYSNGFFDQDWQRMGRDYVMMSDCALKNYSSQLNNNEIIFSGHSKGAYVASVAAGLVEGMNVPFALKSTILFAPAGADQKTLPTFPANSALSVVFSDSDTIVERKFSEQIFSKSSAAKKQFIFLKSYQSLKADHFWPLTQGSAFGGGNESPFHYYGSWKWLVAAAEDLNQGSPLTNPYLYGPLANDKGIPQIQDDIQRSGF